MNKYQDRQEAGRVLAEALKPYAGQHDVLVLALPRGGVPVAFEIAKALKLPLDVFIVRKLGVPWHPELAMGALATGGMRVFNQHIIDELQISKDAINAVITKEQQELRRRELAYRGSHELPVIKDKTIILVDDGIATGATMRVAIQALRQLNPAKIIMAVPVAEKSLLQEMESLVDEFVCPLRPDDFYAVGAWYEDFSQIEDEEVYAVLKEAQY